MRKCVLQPLHLSALNCHHVISDACLSSDSVSISVKVRYPADPSLLAIIHSLCRIALIPCAAVFYFNENHVSLMDADQIDLSQPAPKVSFQNAHAAFSQIIRRQSLPVSACLSVVFTWVYIFPALPLTY